MVRFKTPKQTLYSSPMLIVIKIIYLFIGKADDSKSLLNTMQAIMDAFAGKGWKTYFVRSARDGS